MEEIVMDAPGRKAIIMRLLYTLVFMFVLELVKTIIQLCVLFQYVFLFIVQKPNEPVRSFSNRVVTYAYSVMRYITVTGNDKPFPFNDFPADLEAPVHPVRFE